MELAEEEERQIREYVESQRPGEDGEVTLVQHVGRRRVAGQTHDLYDVWTSDGERWWVITDITNLYSQADFNDIEQAFIYHLGLTVVLMDRSRAQPTEDDQELAGRSWRRLSKAIDAMTEAQEAEDYQAVGVRCREVLLALIREQAEMPWVTLSAAERPKMADFKGWMEVHTNSLTAGRVRSYFRTLAEKAWDLTVWLQHYPDATEVEAELALAATSHFLRTFGLMRTRYDRGEQTRCPECDSYRVTEAVDFGQRDGRLGSLLSEVCLACGWSSAERFEEWPAERIERAIEYYGGDAAAAEPEG